MRYSALIGRFRPRGSAAAAHLPRDSVKKAAHRSPPSSKRFPLLKPTRVPLRYYALLTLIFGALSVINNFVFAFRITMPIHTVVRSSSLVVSLLLGLLFFGKRCVCSSSSHRGRAGDGGALRGCAAWRGC